MRTLSRYSRLFALALALALAAALPAAARAEALQVFACEPEWAALVKALAPGAQVTAATHARQDPHYIEARPALISALRRARLAVCTGASLEAGWLPMLQQRAGNAAVRDGQPGMFYAARQVELIDQRDRIGFNEGDVHPEGNPHLHLDPDRLAQVARALSQRLAQVDPAGAAGYQEPIATVHALYQDGRPSAWLAQQLCEGRAPALALPSTVTDDGPASTLEGLFEQDIAALLKAAAPR